MKQNPPSIADIDKKTARSIRILFLALAVVGSVLFYYYQRTTLGGLGLSGCLFSLVSFFHFLKPRAGKTKHIDTKMTWFLLAMTVVGIILLFANHMNRGPDFYRGIAAGVAMICGLAYGLELLMTWLDNV